MSTSLASQVLTMGSPARAVPVEPHGAARSRVSVVVPCFNYGHFLPDCVASVLSQPAVDVDVLVIDDASPDGSGEVADVLAAVDDRVTAIRHRRNRGHIASYNVGLDAVTGDHVVLLSADDLLTPGALGRATALLDAHPQVGFVYGRPVRFRGAPPPARTSARRWLLWNGADWVATRCRTVTNCIYSPEVVMRTAVLREVGGYHRDLPHIGDLEMWMRAASVSDVGYVVGADQAYYRLHDENMHVARFKVGDAAGMLGDLSQRRRAIEVVFDGAAGRLPAATALRTRAHRALAGEALGLASRAYTWGLTHEWAVAELEAFALETYPDAHHLPQWRSLWLRRAVGERLSRKNPVFVLREKALAVGRDLRHRRWERTGW